MKNEIRSTYIRFVALLKHGDQKPLMYPHQKKKKEKEKEASLVRMTRVHAATVAVEMASNGVAAMVQLLGLHLYWETTRGVKKSWWLWSEWEWVKAYSCIV